MNFFKSSSKVDVKKRQNSLRQLLNDYRAYPFPNGINGPIAIEVDGNKCVIDLPFSLGEFEQQISDYILNALDEKIKLSFQYQPASSANSAINNVKKIIAVASGKGGVGKSTVTSNLAVALAKLGHKVAIVDADIYGPSMPIMFAKQGENIGSKDGKTMEPIFQHGVYVNSIGFLVPDEQATVWRGPMASRALTQLINETNWPELDVLLVDMPPGTGDIQLTMSQTIKCDGAIIVTTPQNVALADAEKGINMFNKVDTPVLGVVENMSHFVCDHCGTEHQLFGKDGGAECAAKHQVPLLGQLPLLSQVREAADNGQPYALEGNNEYAQLAFSLMMQLSKHSDLQIAVKSTS